MKERILVAGIGNIFMGDDAFGVEVVRELMHRPIPDAVCVEDFGIRSYDLAYAIIDGYEATILVDAAPRGKPAGTLYLIEPDLEGIRQARKRRCSQHEPGGRSSADPRPWGSARAIFTWLAANRACLKPTRSA